MYFFLLPALVIVCLGWTVLLGIGIYRKRRKLCGGTVMIVLGSVLVLPGIGITTLAAIAVYHIATWKPMETVPFDAASHAGETGTIRLPFAGDVKLTVEGQGERLLLTGNNGLVVAPAGELKPSHFEVSQEHDGAEWTVSAWLGQRDSTVAVSPGKTVDLDIGPPLTATIAPELRFDREVKLDFRLCGNGPEQYSIRGPKGRSPPRFELRDQGGKIVLSGKFAYG